MTCGDIAYKLNRSKRKTMSIYVEPEGTVTIRAPENTPLEKINNIIELKSYWIYKALAEVKELNSSKIKRKYVDGEGFMYLGKSYRLKQSDNSDIPLSIMNEYFVLNKSKSKDVKKTFIEFYRNQAKEFLPKKLEYFSKKLGVKLPEIKVMDLKKRWASKSKKGLNFHWKIMLAPITVIDYVIVHELAHFKYQNHSDAFWELVGSVMPSYLDRKNWLRLNGAGLDV